MIFVHRARASRSNAVSLALLLVLLAVLPAFAVSGCGTEAVASSTTASQPGGAGSATSTPSAATTTTPSPGSSSTSSVQSPDGSSTSSTASAGGQQGAGEWPTYGHDMGRSGMSTDQGAVGSPAQAWTSVDFDAPIYAQPLVVDGRVFVASEGNTVYALDAATGTVAWQRNLGEPVPASDLPCGNIDPSGITGTPVIDTGGGTLYAVANLRTGPHHELFALSLSDGTVLWHRAVDPPGLAPAVLQERGALALAGGRVYVPFGGLYGDCGPYKGAVVSVAADASGDVVSYVVPTRRMAGIWNPEGPAVDQGGDLWVTTGNSAGQATFDFGNALIRLSPALEVLDYFAPSDWARLNAGDVDLGSLGPALLPNGRVLVAGKDGIAYLTDAGNLGHVGNPLASLDIGSSAFGAPAVSGSTVFIPTTGALVAVLANGDKLQVAWKVGGGSGPPIVAAGAVWALSYDGKLRAIEPATGRVLFSAQLGGPVSRFISPSAAAGKVFVADGSRLVAFAMR
jgi:outer membrane protein assembly factor BamB